MNLLSRILLLATTVAGPCFVAPAPAQTLTGRELAPVVSHMAALLEAHYVFPEQGRRIAASLRARHHRGAFRGVRTWQGFDSVATRVLRQISHDGHLYVRFDPATVRELRRAPAGQAAESSSQDPFYYGAEAAQHNFGFAEVQVLAGNVGYVRLSEINLSERSLPVLHAAMTLVANTRALILDLRGNGGGGSAVGPVLESYFLPQETPLLEVHARAGRQLSQTVTWLTQPRYQQPLFILTNKKTFSAAEALAFALQAHKRAVVVGQASGGGAHMNSWYPLTEQLYLSVSTSAPTLPGSTATWEGRGVQPDHVVAEGQEIEFIRATLLGR